MHAADNAPWADGGDTRESFDEWLATSPGIADDPWLVARLVAMHYERLLAAVLDAAWGIESDLADFRTRFSKKET